MFSDCQSGPEWSPSSLIGEVSAALHPRNPFFMHQFSLFPLSGDIWRTAEISNKQTIRNESSWFSYVMPPPLLVFYSFRQFVWFFCYLLNGLEVRGEEAVIRFRSLCYGSKEIYTISCKTLLLHSDLERLHCLSPLKSAKYFWVQQDYKQK